MSCADCCASSPTTHSNSGGFEGPEKHLELDFRPSGDDRGAFHDPEHSLGARVDGEGLLQVPDVAWAPVLQAACVNVLSILSTPQIKMFLLSESSMFVSPRKVVMKTCGTTRLLCAIPSILEIAATYGLEVEFAAFHRRNYIFPTRQPSPHCTFPMEVAFLQRFFPSGRGHVIGPVDGPHTHLFVSDLTRYEAAAPSDSADVTLEVMMTGLPESTMAQFFKNPADAASLYGAHADALLAAAGGLDDEAAADAASAQDTTATRAFENTSANADPSASAVSSHPHPPAAVAPAKAAAALPKAAKVAAPPAKEQKPAVGVPPTITAPPPEPASDADADHLALVDGLTAHASSGSVEALFYAVSADDAPDFVALTPTITSPTTVSPGRRWPLSPQQPPTAAGACLAAGYVETTSTSGQSNSRDGAEGSPPPSCLPPGGAPTTPTVSGAPATPTGSHASLSGGPLVCIDATLDAAYCENLRAPGVAPVFFQEPRATILAGKAAGARVTRKAGIHTLVPGSVIDAYFFDPCGYSMNGVASGEHYWTMHITPEPQCSFASFELCVPRKDYHDVVERVLALFRPEDAIVRVFADARVTDASAALAHDRVTGYAATHVTSMTFDGPYGLLVTNLKRSTAGSPLCPPARLPTFVVDPSQDAVPPPAVADDYDALEDAAPRMAAAAAESRAVAAAPAVACGGL